MKRAILAFIVFFSAINIHTQELQLSVGLEAGFGTFKIDNDFSYREGMDAYLFNQTTKSVFFAPGISFSTRIFLLEKNDISMGFFFRSRVIFMAYTKHIGTVSVGDYTELVSFEASSLHENGFTSITDYDTGISYRFLISDRLSFLTDFGANLTIMDSKDHDTKDTLSYFGFGIFGGLALQVNLTNTLYLEFGANASINAFSSQEGTFQLPITPFRTINIKYEDSGRWDLYSAAAYIHIGWRLGLKE